MNAQFKFVLLAIIALLPGCVTLQTCTIDCKNKFIAWQAWTFARPTYRYEGMPSYLRRHYGHGFKAAYYDVASGSDGATPLFPPDCYWGVWFQNPRGYEQVQAWFAGYQDGAIAAQQDGVTRWSMIPTSRGPNPPEAAEQATPGSYPGEMVPPGSPQFNPQPDSQYLEELPPRPVSWNVPAGAAFNAATPTVVPPGALVPPGDSPAGR